VKFFLDHDVPADVGRVLQAKGYAVQSLEEVLPRTETDLKALRYAREHGRIVITCNRGDFLQLANIEPHCGIIILVRRRSRIAECAAVLALIKRAGAGGISHNLNFA